MHFRDVPQHPVFEASSCGIIIRKSRIGEGVRCGKKYTKKLCKTKLTPWVAKNGYYTISCAIDGVRKKYFVHRLVAMAFVDGYQPHLTVNHINGIKTDNRACNLEWVTLSENTKLQWETGLVNIRGEKHPLAKISDNDVVNIRNDIKNGAKIVDIANQYGVSTALIYKIRKGTKKKFIT